MASALVALLGACAHAPAPPRPLPAVAWPEPPAEARVRLVAVLPDPEAPLPRRSVWRRVADAITGLDPAERRDALLVRPFGVAVAPDGTVVVADPDAPALLRFGPGGAVERVACRSREWAAPIAVALGAHGELVVADAGAGEIVVVGPDRRCRAMGAGALERPTGVALSGERFLVVDPPRHQVVSLSPTGEVVGRWGEHGDGEGQFNFPTSIAPAPGGGFLVVDALNFRIVRISPEGRWLGAFGTRGESGGSFARPKGVASDAAGRVYVTDAQRDLVLVFGPGGELDYSAGASGTAPGYFTNPSGIAVHDGRLYVADSLNRRVQVFQILGGSS